MHPIINILKILGLNTNHKGFMCIARVLHYLLLNPAKLCGHMKTELYPFIEEIFELSYENAKRAIKFVIMSAEFNDDPELRNKFSLMCMKAFLLRYPNFFIGRLAYLGPS